MKTWCQVLLIFLVITACFGQTQKARKKKKQKLKKIITEYYIDNWTKYGMPKKILTEDLRIVLENVALYGRDKYCPFGPSFKDCENKTIVEGIAKIIADATSKDNDSYSDITILNSDKRASRNRLLNYDSMYTRSDRFTNYPNNPNYRQTYYPKHPWNNKKTKKPIDKIYLLKYETLKPGRKCKKRIQNMGPFIPYATPKPF